MSNFRKVAFLKVFIFGDMNDWNMPVNITCSILLSDDFCWLPNGSTLKTVFYVIIYQKLGGLRGSKIVIKSFL